MNKRHYEHTLPNIRGSLSNTYIKSIVSDCSDKKCKLHSHISVIEELHDNIVYIGLDNDFYSTYQEILKKIPLQKILENGILVSMDNA